MGDLGIRTGFDSSFTSEKKKLSYPYLYVPRFGEEIALMVTCLEPGPLPIVLSDSGVLKQVVRRLRFGACEATSGISVRGCAFRNRPPHYAGNK